MFYCEIFLLLSNSTASTGALPLDVQSTVAEAIQVLLAILRKYLLECLRSRRSAKSSVGLYLLLASLLTIKFKVEILLCSELELVLSLLEQFGKWPTHLFTTDANAVALWFEILEIFIFEG